MARPPRPAAPKSPPETKARSPPPRELSPEAEKRAKLDRVNQQIAELKASMKRSTAPVQTTKEEKMSALEAMIPATSTRGRKRGKVTDERGALDLFNSFKKRLEHMPVKPSAEQPDASGD